MITWLIKYSKKPDAFVYPLLSGGTRKEVQKILLAYNGIFDYGEWKEFKKANKEFFAKKVEIKEL